MEFLVAATFEKSKTYVFDGFGTVGTSHQRYELKRCKDDQEMAIILGGPTET
jgi:hypothetical protein